MCCDLPDRMVLVGFWPEDADQQQRCPFDQRHELRQQRQRAGISPVQIFADQDDRPVLHSATEDVFHGAEGMILEILGAHFVQPFFPISRQRQCHEARQEGHGAFLIVRTDHADEPLQRGCDHFRRVFHRCAQCLAQQVLPKVIGNFAVVRKATPLDPANSSGRRQSKRLFLKCLADLSHQTRLADARFPYQSHETSSALMQPVNGRAQSCELGLPSHQRRIHSGNTAQLARVWPQTQDPVGHGRLAAPAQRQPAQRFHLADMGNQTLGRFAGQHRIRFCHFLQVKRQRNRIAADHERAAVRLAGGDHGAGMNPDAHGELQRMSVRQRHVQGCQPGLHGQGRAHRPLRVVLVHLWHAEHGHDCIADVFLNDPAELQNGCGDRGEEGSL